MPLVGGRSCGESFKICISSYINCASSFSRPTTSYTASSRLPTMDLQSQGCTFGKLRSYQSSFVSLVTQFSKLQTSTFKLIMANLSILSEEADPQLEDSPNDTSNDPLIPYSTFTKWQKSGIVFLTGYTAMFSPLSSFIYYPAITPITPILESLHVSIELINLTITSYLVVSGIAPALLGDMADIVGRRLIYLAVITIYVGANVGLALSSEYATLLILRMVQSFGASGRYNLEVQ